MLNRILPGDRLDLLRAADRERTWHSLDDKRVCALCERVFSGRELDLRKEGRFQHWHCPSEDCPSDFRHWLIWRPPARVPAPTEGKDYNFL